MKELSIEEKAKRYDEAIEIARKINSGDGVPVPPDWTTCEVIFPELKESEDEKIRNGLIGYFRAGKCENVSSYHGISTNDILAWLEKQVEQKPVHEIVPTPIFRIGDILKRKGKDYTFRVDRIQAGYYHCDRNNGAFFPIEEQDNWELIEQKPDWSEKYIADVFEKVGLAKIAREQGYDALTEAIQFAMIELSKFTPQPKQKWSEEDEKIYQSIMDDTVQENQLNDKQTNWLRDIKYRYFPQPKQEWSEDDIKEFKAELQSLMFEWSNKKDNMGVCIDRHIDKLLSILWNHTQSQWKPSDEQIEILDMVLSNESMDDNIARILRELREQLKKLTE